MQIHVRHMSIYKELTSFLHYRMKLLFVASMQIDLVSSDFHILLLFNSTDFRFTYCCAVL